MRKLPTLKTSRLILRPFKLEDAPAITPLANNKNIATNTENLPYPYEEYMAIDWISAHQEMYDDDHMLTLAVTTRKKDQVIGAIGLEIETVNNNAELGYWFGEPYWGNGYATEAARRILHYGFMELKYHRIFAVHLSQTPASGNVLKKLGMKHEGMMREHTLKWGDYLDTDYWGILQREYKEQA